MHDLNAPDQHRRSPNGSPIWLRFLLGAAFPSLLILIVGSLAPSSATAPSAKPNAQTFEPGEDMPGGAATSKGSVDNANAFSHSSGNMPFEDELKFKVGNGMFKKMWVSSPASTLASDGLGPLFNARSCQACHIKDGRGHPPANNDDSAVSMLLRLSVPASSAHAVSTGTVLEPPVKSAPEPVYGEQLQDLSIQGHDAEGKFQIAYNEKQVTLRGGETVFLRAPRYSIANLAYGPLHPQVMMSPRIAPPMIGLGLLEAIPERAILALADSDDENRDGVSGRPHRVPQGNGANVTALGRFGWKASSPTIRQQSAEAFAGDIGISTPVIRRPAGDCTEAQSFCRNAPNGETAGAPEIEDELFDLVVFYSQNLAVPRRRSPRSPEVLKGKQLFAQTGCAACHNPSFKTGESPDQPHLSNQTIWPYTDLLLHDMGEGLADNRPDGDANGREWRTPPLWGIGLTETVNGHTFFLHDGRARNIQEAILWHGGEGQKARDAFAALTKREREQLIAFVNSL